MMNLSYLNTSFGTIDHSWQKFLSDNYHAQLTSLDELLEKLSHQEIIYPAADNTLRTLQLDVSKVKVVILGQDPYHGENEANGLAFAVNENIKVPPSLRNIFKELTREFNPALANINNTLEQWFNQGVMLLNASLTVIKDKPNSLAKIGWHEITDGIIQHISNVNPNCVFLLWGNYARSKKTLIDSNKHLVLESVHPSPLAASRGFFGCNHFILANEFLQQHNLTPIEWL